jgi:hypothetical protein
MMNDKLIIWMKMKNLGWMKQSNNMEYFNYG